MPDVVGMNLQEAQDLIQSVSGDILFFTSSVDATGDDRMQLVDSNWYVCAQNVPADTTVSNDADITFAVVKTDEVSVPNDFVAASAHAPDRHGRTRLLGGHWASPVSWRHGL